MFWTSFTSDYDRQKWRLQEREELLSARRETERRESKRNVGVRGWVTGLRPFASGACREWALGLHRLVLNRVPAAEYAPACVHEWQREPALHSSG